MDERPLCEAAAKIAELGARLSVRNVNELDGCWEHQIDERWWVACNGHDEPTACSRGPKVQPFNFYIEYNGFPAGSLDPYGGIIAAGEAANEDTFIAAVDAAIAAVPVNGTKG